MDGRPKSGLFQGLLTDRDGVSTTFKIAKKDAH